MTVALLYSKLWDLNWFIFTKPLVKQAIKYILHVVAESLRHDRTKQYLYRLKASEKKKRNMEIEACLLSVAF